MKATEIRSKYIEFFKSKSHAVIKSSSLVPDNDPTVLFTMAGMHPLVPYLLGENHPSGTRLVNYQKCIRTGDIAEVGDNTHLTFFEMLGNWSLGDYMKDEAIRFSFEFLTDKKWLNIPLEKLAFTVFAGDENAPFDQESYNLWLSLGVKAERIAKLPKEDNWWGPAGLTGPCGPDSEMFYWSGEEPAPSIYDPSDKRWVEIWNDVFLQYNKTADGKFELLQKPNIDTGMGLERVTALLQSKATCYDTELFAPIFSALDKLRNISTPLVRDKSERILADHIRAATFIMADGVSPGNKDRQYQLRRIIRRAIGEGNKLGLAPGFTTTLAKAVIETFSEFYPELSDNQTRILDNFTAEEKDFEKTLVKGIQMFEKAITRPENINGNILSGRIVFDLAQTYGYPMEMAVSMAEDHGFSVNMKEYEEAFRHHQDISRGASAPSGMADNKEETTALHTATHLLHKALRMVLGEHIEQRGSNITAERLRFDFFHHEKVSSDDLAKVEKIVNEVIERDLTVTCIETSPEEAYSLGAIGLFASKYGEKVRVYSIGDFSREICSGPHVSNTGKLKSFHIVKEEAVSKGVRRIKAIIG